MAILILLTLGILFSGVAATLQRNAREAVWRHAALYTIIIAFLFIAFSTELLSALHAFHRTGILITWILALITSGVLLYRQRTYFSLPKKLPTRSPIFWSVIIILVVTLLTGALSFPNNWDSMTYHLARAMQWIHRGSVAHYPTQIERQLNLAPLSEYAFAHILALSNIPAFTAWVPWVCFAGSIIAVTLITRTLGGSRRAQLLSAGISATIPMAILQSSSTQNDLVVGFFILCALYFMLTFWKYPERKYAWSFFLVVMGCAVLTKGTGILFLLPVIGIALGVAVRHRIRIPYKHIMIGSAVAVALLVPHAVRNMHTFGSPGGNDYDLQNTQFGTGPLVANVSKNIGMHFRTPFDPVNTLIENKVAFWHRLAGVEMNDPDLNWSYSPEFSVGMFSTHEDSAGNALHVLLFIGIMLIILFRKKWRSDHVLLVYTGIWMSVFLLFCVFVKWQLWNVRLHTPLFFIAAPMAAVVLDNANKVLRHGMISMLILGALPFVFLNQTRPWFAIHPKQTTTIFSGDHIDDLARNHNDIALPYRTLDTLLTTLHADTISLLSGGDTWEFPLWYLLHTDHPMVINLDPENASAQCNDPYKNATLDAILVYQNGRFTDTLQYRSATYILAHTGPKTPLIYIPRSSDR